MSAINSQSIPLISLRQRIQHLLSTVEQRPTNNHHEQEQATGIAIHAILTDLAKPYAKHKDAVAKKVRATVQPGGNVTALVSPPVTVTASVKSGRTSFDKETFIAEVSSKYNIPAKELFDLASKTVTTSQSMVTMIPEISR